MPSGAGPAPGSRSSRPGRRSHVLLRHGLLLDAGGFEGFASRTKVAPPDAPLAFGSCRPVALASPYVTVGTPDANGAAANFNGWVSLRVVAGVSGPPDDADVKLAVNMSDIRCFAGSGAGFCGSPNVTAGQDYTGTLEGRLSLRITDKNNSPSPGQLGPGTVQDTPLSYTIGCAETGGGMTPNVTMGSNCSVDTTLDAILPGVVRDEKAGINWSKFKDNDDAESLDSGLPLDMRGLEHLPEHKRAVRRPQGDDTDAATHVALEAERDESDGAGDIPF
jgi:hypothetical protein